MAELAWHDALARSPGRGDAVVLVNEGGVLVRLVPDLTLVTLVAHRRADDDWPPTALAQVVQRVLGCPPAFDANTRNGNDQTGAVWLDPTRWLLFAARRQRVALLPELLQALVVPPGGTVATAHDSSDALATLDISGANAPTLMAMACPLDLDVHTYAPPRTARTHFAGVTALLYRHREGMRVHVDATLLVHVRDWLRQAVRLVPGEG